MRSVLIVLALAGSAWSQAFTEVAGAAVGGSVGGVAGKNVSAGITSVFQKVDATASKAAKTGKSSDGVSQKAPVQKGVIQKGSEGTILQVGPAGVVKDHSLVPPPPPVRRAAAVVPPPPQLAPLPTVVQPIPVLPPPPQVTREDLQALASGTTRRDLLKLGAPSSRITMYDDGHLVEIYRYQSRDTTFGTVRLSVGTVSNVQVRP